MELDSGAAVSIVSETTWSEHLHNPQSKVRAIKSTVAELPRQEATGHKLLHSG